MSTKSLTEKGEGLKLKFIDDADVPGLIGMAHDMLDYNESCHACRTCVENAKAIKSLLDKAQTALQAKLGPEKGNQELRELVEQTVGYLNDLSHMPYPYAKGAAELSDRIATLLDKAEAPAPEADKWAEAMRALESLTVGGSEFVGDVDACVAYVRKKVSTLQDIAKKATIRANDWRERALAAEAAILADNPAAAPAEADKHEAPSRSVERRLAVQQTEAPSAEYRCAHCAGNHYEWKCTEPAKKAGQE